MIEHDQVDSTIDIVVSGTGDLNQVCGCPYTRDINYNTVSLVLTDDFVRDSKQSIGSETNPMVFKLELQEKNDISLL